MPDLIAQGPEQQQRWRRPITLDTVIVLGRTMTPWSVAWDDHISREHARLCWQGGRLQVDRLPSASNPIFVNGRQVDSCALRPGEYFVIGLTTFTVTDEQINVSLDVPRPAAEQTFSQEFLREVKFRNADQRIEVLARLPGIIAGAANDTELSVRMVNALFTGIPAAAAAAIVAVDPQRAGRETRVLHWDRRLVSGDDFRPSERLIRAAIDAGENVVHVWKGDQQRESAGFTEVENVDWAFCTPIPGEACHGWAIYVTGQFADGGQSGPRVMEPSDLRDELKFTEVVATTFSNHHEVRRLEHERASLSPFFSPIVLAALSSQAGEVVLAPRETEVSVLFCDLRGFSRTSEQAADDLLGLLERVSRALGVMTRQIFDQGGVVGDFHGDAAMGFWGWPIAQEDAVQRAARAAMGTVAEFEQASQRPGDPLTDFRVGLGIATGRAVAGQIGTTDQVKVTVFGPVVNLASRLEGMTKVLRANVLLDERTARFIRGNVATDVARVRRLAVVRPYGMQHPLEVSELLPPVADYPRLTDANIADYEMALDALQNGNWDDAFELLHQIPPDDRAKDFLTVFIAQHNRTAPSGWDGVIPIETK